MIKRIIGKLYKWGTQIIIWLAIFISFIIIIRFLAFDVYYVPSASMEGTIMTGDVIGINKLLYGTRFFYKGKCYRIPGLGSVKQNDIVVFNFPEGDTVYKNMPTNNYYEFKRAHARGRDLPQGMEWQEKCYLPIQNRPVYVKRCIGMPGDKLKIVKGNVYCNNTLIEKAENNFQHYYMKNVRNVVVPAMNSVGVTQRWEVNNGNMFEFNATEEQYLQLKKLYPEEIIEPMFSFWKRDNIFPFYPDRERGGAYDNYGPVYIPAKGDTLELSIENMPLYQRLISTYENNVLEVKDEAIHINGKQTTEYVVQQNYYFMIGDNRSWSTDSRSWGYVPEDHVIGIARMVLFNKKKDGPVNWNPFGVIE